jgi:hypothetical protein
MRRKKMIQQIHHQIRAQSPDVNAHDFLIYTDGSGYSDGYGGSACLVKSSKHNKREVRLIAYSHTSTDRAEFEALLAGLQSILECMGWDDTAELKALKFKPKKPSVCWFTDRESLVLSIWRDEDGNTIYKRRKQGDLWARFEYYEGLFDITPMLIPRNSMDEHAFVDRLASEARLLVKEYLEVITLDQEHAKS